MLPDHNGGMSYDTRVSRNEFLKIAAVFAAMATLPASGQEGEGLTAEDVAKAEKLVGVELTEEQRNALVRSLANQRRVFDELRDGDIPNDLAPATPFVPQGKVKSLSGPVEAHVIRRDRLRKPDAEEDLAFMTLAELGVLIRSRQVTSRQLTELALRRLKEYGPRLLCLVNLTEERALAQADLMDAEIRRGHIRSHVHGIPYGIKDIFAAKGAPTTWGAEPYRNQVIDQDATVVQKLEAAGAVLCAKLANGALAMGDVWYAGTCRNPWNPTQGSSGSSAGSASAMAAGLVPFTIGTETLGSIVSPSQRCRVTGLRPTFGRVSRAGAMTLSWTMDKVGPICRTAEDCALVLTAIVGADSADLAAVNRPFRYRPGINLSRLKIGYLQAEGLDQDDTTGDLNEVLDLLREIGGDPQPIKFTPAIPGVDDVLVVEAAAAFDQLTRSGEADTMKDSFWPTIFRTAMFLTGVDYLQAMRVRTTVMQRFEQEFGDFDFFVAPDRGGYTLFLTNLTGHPQLYIPLGVQGIRGRGVSLVGRLYDEETILAVGTMIQEKRPVYRNRPDLRNLPVEGSPTVTSADLGTNLTRLV